MTHPDRLSTDIHFLYLRLLAHISLRIPWARPVQTSNGHKPDLPDVIVGGQLRDTTRQALDALARKEELSRTIFVQSGSYSLVRIAKDKEGRPAIKPMGVPEIKLAMTRSGNYFSIKVNKQGETEYINTSPPKEVAEQILSLPPGDWPFPLLDAIVEVPQLRLVLQL